MSAESGVWAVFQRPTEEGMTFLMIRADAEEAFPPERFPHLVVLAVPTTYRGPNMFPEEGERAAVDRIWDASERVKGLAYVGRITAERGFRLHFYVKDIVTGQEQIKALARSKAGVSECSTSAIADDQWRTYRQVLSPNPEERQTWGDSQVLHQLHMQGDDGTEPRPVEHWMYFETEQSRSEVWDALSPEGFELVDGLDRAEDGRYALRVIREDQPCTISEVTIHLHRLCGRVGGGYDGWETELRGPNSPRARHKGRPKPPSLLSRVRGWLGGRGQ